MKKYFASLLLLNVLSSASLKAQNLKEQNIPSIVKAALIKKYPDAKKVSWEMEKGNYEANWGGKSGEDNSAIFTPAANFIEIVKAIPVSELPSNITLYVAKHFTKAHITEAGRITDATGKLRYKVEIKGKDLIFDEKGMFVQAD